jgi:hypothetical protein
MLGGGHRPPLQRVTDAQKFESITTAWRIPSEI